MVAENKDRWKEDWIECWKESWKEAWKEARREAWKEGRREGAAALVLRLLHLKFGLLEPKAEIRVRSADSERLLVWAERILTAETLEDVLQD